MVPLQRPGMSGVTLFCYHRLCLQVPNSFEHALRAQQNLHRNQSLQMLDYLTRRRI